VPARNSGDHTQFTILKGSAFIHINNLDGSALLLPVMVDLARGLLESIPQGRAVTLQEELPEKAKIPGSERLIRGPYALQSIFTLGEGDILDLRGNIFALAADYKDQEGEPSTRLLVFYPDESRAEVAFHNLLANLDPYLKVVERRDGGLFSRITARRPGASRGSDEDSRSGLTSTPPRRGADILTLAPEESGGGFRRYGLI